MIHERNFTKKKENALEKRQRSLHPKRGTIFSRNLRFNEYGLARSEKFDGCSALLLRM